MAVSLGSNQKKGGMLIKNGQPPPEIQDDEGDSHLNEDLEDSRFNNLLGLGSGSQQIPQDSLRALKNIGQVESYSSFQADEKKEVRISTSPEQKDLKGVEKGQKSVKNTKIPETVEEQMQKYEAQIRNHISVEQQFLLHFEAMQTKIEMQQLELNEVVAKLDKVQHEKKTFHDNKEKEIVILRDSIKDMENELKKLRDEASQDRLLGNMSNV